MAEDQPFFQGCGHMTDSPGAESPASVPPQDTLMEDSDCDQEIWHVWFRTFSSSEESDPFEDLRRLRELCHLWLRPDLHTKEQMMDRLVLEQFMICMPLECQVLLKESEVQSCKALEDVLRNKQKPKNWTIVCIQGQKYPVRGPDIEMNEAKAGDMDDERDPCGEPEPPSRVIPPEDGQEGSQELQNLPGAMNLSREQDQRALPPETVPETEGDVSTMSGSRRGPVKNCRHVKRKRDSSPTCQDVGQEAATCLDPGEFSGQRGSHLLVHLAPWDPPVFLREQKPRDGHPLNAGCAKRAFLINLSLPCTRGHTQDRGLFSATSVPKCSYSFQICRFMSRSTLTRSPTAVISASRSSPRTPRCALTRGPTPRRSLSAVSSVTELSATEGTSVFTDAPTLGSSPTCAPSVMVPSVSWGLSNATGKSIPDDWLRTLPSGPSAFCSVKEIRDYLSLM
ncbi:zinc finger and SCAN domain-containing protein 5B-like isoform X2 [Bubalus kerabau]|uniref:zinc finger and SCAN domain-containing protein 5B-like isoform X2 n=1 Tax=Bubalus carabanensis TaxID=3119969 RepID=UPI00244E9450|nr:zinc finger and SCAN domain-containing protein 5B-like isoform X2 [Bubalus carabanensis]